MLRLFRDLGRGEIILKKKSLNNGYRDEVKGCKVDKLFKGRNIGISIFDKQSKQFFVVDNRKDAEVVLDKFFGMEKKRLNKEIKSLKREFRNLRF